MTNLAASPTLGRTPMKLHVSRLKMVPLFFWGQNFLKTSNLWASFGGDFLLNICLMEKNYTPTFLNQKKPAGQLGFPCTDGLHLTTREIMGIWLGDFGDFLLAKFNEPGGWVREKVAKKTHNFWWMLSKSNGKLLETKSKNPTTQESLFWGNHAEGPNPHGNLGCMFRPENLSSALPAGSKSNFCDSNQNHFPSTCQGKNK